MRTPRSHRLALALALAAATGTASTWAATETTKAPAPSETYSTSWDVPTAPVPAVDASAKASFVIFREQPATGMPAEAAKQVGSPERFGRNPALARSIDTVNGIGWVIPGDGFICLAMKDPVDGYGTSCVPTTLAVRQGVSLRLGTDDPDGRVAEIALVPDGQRAVLADGTEVPTRDGIASVAGVGDGQLQVAP